jgi:dihydroorotase-like cyclic amidohydrolase
MLPLLLTAVADRRLSLERLVQLTHDAPRRLFDLPEPAECWVEVDPAAHHTLGKAGLLTRCGWTPFEGMPAVGRVQRVVLRGQTVFEERVRVQPGFGRAVVPVRHNG